MPKRVQNGHSGPILDHILDPVQRMLRLPVQPHRQRFEDTTIEASTHADRAVSGLATSADVIIVLFQNNMPEDLYRVDLQSVPGSSLYRLIHEFTSMDRPIGDRPREGYLLDYKEDVSDRFLRSVAAFANTFGGLLIVGATELDGRPEKLIGVSVRGELKTKIASMIASNLFPCPQFEIAECELPTDAERKLAVVRVRETQEICLLAKKGEPHPVYVRNEDQSPPADASQLRALLDRKSKNKTPAAEIESQLVPIRNRLHVNIGGGTTRSETYFRLIVCPHTHPSMPLDLGVERKFSEIVSAPFLPGLQTFVVLPAKTGQPT